MFVDIKNVKKNQEFSFLEQLVSQDAPFTSAAAYKVQRRECTMNTRISVLENIMSWAQNPVRPLPSSLFWVYGLAGTGKSTILQTICAMLENKKLLASSYFCSIQLDSRESKRIVPTIARHLASRFPPFANQLIMQLHDHPDSAHAQLPVQFRDLLCTPWRTAKIVPHPLLPCVVVIDALDECDRGDEILDLIIGATEKNTLHGIQFLISSRPRPSFMKRVQEIPRGPHIALHEIEKEEVSCDIRLFLEEELRRRINEEQIRELVDRADGLFIFASTLIKHLVPSWDLTQPERQERLTQILAPRHEGEKVGLDALYNHIVCDALDVEKFGQQGFEHRLLILQTIVSTAEATSARVIADLLWFNVDDVMCLVNSLHSVLFASTQDEPIFIIHASFHDFVITQTTAPFTYQLSPIHFRLARSCYAHMKGSLRFNLCNIQSSFTEDKDLVSPLQSLGSTLAYVCRYWWNHVVKCGDVGKKGMQSWLEAFLKEKGLFWIEAMSLMKSERPCRDILEDIASISFNLPDIQKLATDAAEMVTMFISISPKMTSQLYLSALPFSRALACWKSQFRHIPSVTSRRIDGVQKCKAQWNFEFTPYCVAFSPEGGRVVSGSDDAIVRFWDTESGEELIQLAGHNDVVSFVAFSPDGRRVASGSRDKTVRIWDAESGEELSQLDGHDDSVFSVAFSPDGRRIISGSREKTVRIWDAKSGVELSQLNGHGGFVHSVAFSPDGKKVVSGSGDKTVRIWDAESGEELSQLYGHDTSVIYAAFSPDSTRVTSASEDKTVRIWDAESGKELGQLNGYGGSVQRIAFSPDGRQFVSGSFDGTVRIWDAKSGEALSQLNGHINPVHSVAFSPDGRRVVSSSSYEMRIWDAECREEPGRIWLTGQDCADMGCRIWPGT
ncbi:hypothetical protein DL96DRAFT_875974 [Flagelloscypha sp. PMI_526]|nr:hypothetical protein DL96DRAFT_875974 [Flagelloscypha sp. PMI_526]